MKRLINIHRWVAAAAVLLLAWGSLRAAEVTTNGSGGGAWSEAATWRGKKVPTAEDDVVIQKGDAVVFDRDDDGKITCEKLFIDPKGALSFKTGAGKVVLCPAGGVEAYGVIRMDGSKAATDHLELRLTGSQATKRGIKLLKGAALLARGRAGLADGRHNVILAAPPGNQDNPLTGALEAGAVSTIDMQHCDAVNLYVVAKDIDNTGSRPNEKLNIADNRFTGLGRIFCERCDTPLIARNTLIHTGPLHMGLRAIHVSECPLAEVRGNIVRGAYDYGIANGHGADVTISGNTLEFCGVGIHLGFGRSNSVNHNVIEGCDRAFDLAYTQLATLEENTVDGAQVVVRTQHATAQFTTLRVRGLRKDGVGILYGSDGTRSGGSVSLLNCSISADQVKFEKVPDRDDKLPPPVTAMHYLVVGAKGAPADAEVEVRTRKPAPPAPDAADLNVRNSPAPLGKETTPLPQPAGSPLTLSPLVVKAWVIDFDGKTLQPPEYSVRVLLPADKPGAPRKVLGSATARPADDWFRAKPNGGKPTLEVTLK